VKTKKDQDEVSK